MLRRTIQGMAVVAICLALSSLNTTAQGRSDDESSSRIQQGFRIAPVPLNLDGKNRASVGLGSYLVNAAGACTDCHSNPLYAPGGDPHLGQPEVINTATYLAGGRAFGSFISRNLTPDVLGRPAGLTFPEFRQMMRTGVDDDALPPNVPSASLDLLQVMPWPLVGKMTDHDLKAIYDYLSAIPCIEGGPGVTGPRCTP